MHLSNNITYHWVAKRPLIMITRNDLCITSTRRERNFIQVSVEGPHLSPIGHWQWTRSFGKSFIDYSLFIDLVLYSMSFDLLLLHRIYSIASVCPGLESFQHGRWWWTQSNQTNVIWNWIISIHVLLAEVRKSNSTWWIFIFVGVPTLFHALLLIHFYIFKIAFN